MKYSIIQLPFPLNFREMTRREAKAYHLWFVEQIPMRISILEQAVRSTNDSEFQSWAADETVESLDALGKWFAFHVNLRKRTEKEKEEIYSGAPLWFRRVQIEDWELANKTFSLAVDIGIYLGQVFVKNRLDIRWEMLKNSKNDADYQQPVLVGFGNLVCNPLRLAVTLAYDFARGSQPPGRLRELFELWSGYVKNPKNEGSLTH